jgi:hypothetical protein
MDQNWGFVKRIWRVARRRSAQPTMSYRSLRKAGLPKRIRRGEWRGACPRLGVRRADLCVLLGLECLGHQVGLPVLPKVNLLLLKSPEPEVAGYRCALCSDPGGVCPRLRRCACPDVTTAGKAASGGTGQAANARKQLIVFSNGSRGGAHSDFDALGCLRSLRARWRLMG